MKFQKSCVVELLTPSLGRFVDLLRRALSGPVGALRDTCHGRTAVCFSHSHETDSFIFRICPLFFFQLSKVTSRHIKRSAQFEKRFMKRRLLKIGGSK